MFAVREPSRRGSRDVVGSGSRIAAHATNPSGRTSNARRPGRSGVAGHLPDVVAPLTSQRLERRLPTKVQQHTVAI